MDDVAERQLKDHLYEALKLAIITCELPPGAELSEGYLSARYGVGKAPVRHALSRLGQDGWVTSIPRSGHLVAPMTLDDVADIFAMREIVEPESAARAAGKISEVRLKRLNRACANPYRISDVAAKRRFLLANRDFHVAIAEACGSPRLARSVAKLHDESLRVLYLSASEKELSGDWSRGHGPMIEAIATGDREAARQTTLDGIKRSRDAVMTVFQETPELITGRRTLRAPSRRLVERIG
ncbi:GntR family transcriptional regulator [Methylobacterium nodulans]|uniref:Transcriptional regulator, GntR family n=1 Tax=Methylobacterium nodulans (strain LMG 21967 / CNCM I-2342 / ORS 2060) TaxID=460265 RepID=B8IA79_METNO|nr:GntR family transcriptional regulator [Methylobacterium nodulans]ACL59142.1 transcriptional regulator, GntR family [Methylobacterium nodulans ORS 2060]